VDGPRRLRHGLLSGVQGLLCRAADSSGRERAPPRSVRFRLINSAESKRQCPPEQRGSRRWCERRCYRCKYFQAVPFRVTPTANHSAPIPWSPIHEQPRTVRTPNTSTASKRGQCRPMAGPEPHRGFEQQRSWLRKARAVEVDEPTLCRLCANRRGSSSALSKYAALSVPTGASVRAAVPERGFESAYR
jgi:hypothetical protein